MNYSIVIVIYLTTYLMCTVSMVLTALFALSFTSHGLFDFLIIGHSDRDIVPILMLMSGLSIDLCKYIFWKFKTKSISFKLISILLMLISWFASVTFFVSQERDNLEENRKSTAAYKSYKIQVSSLESEIEIKRSIVNKRMRSRYHNQWDKSEELVSDIKELQSELHLLIEQESKVGLEKAWEAGNSLIIFNNISQMIGLPVNIISYISYALLALLIEVCALGLIDLSKITSKNKKFISVIKKQLPKKKPNSNRGRLTKKEIKRKTSIIRKAIINRECHPKLKLISVKYNLSDHTARVILSGLVDDGYLIREGKRYKYKDND